MVLSKELKGQKTILNNVFFGSGQYDLDAKSTNELLFLVELLKDNPDLKIQISGHTDNVGKEEKNLLLSKQRAEAVKAFLQHYQISGGRITTKGFGSSQPIVSNHTKEGRSKNRRTEFELF